MRYAYCRNNHVVSDFCVQFPISLIHAKPFKKLSLEACFLYVCLLNAQTLMHTADKKGHAYILVSEKEIGGLLRCGMEKARQVLSELSDDAGLVFVPEGQKERLQVYVKNFERPILPPNARRKFGI